MIQDTLPGEGPGEDDSLSETIAAALEEDRGEDVIHELANVSDDAPETPETDDEALSDDGNGAEMPGHGGTDQTDEGETPSAQAQEEAAPEPEPETDTGTADQYRQVAEIYRDAVAPYSEHLASRGLAPSRVVSVLLAVDHQLSTGTPERKAQILAKLAKEYGVDLGALADMDDAEPANPELAQIQQRIGGIERLINGERQQVAAQVQQDAEAQVTAFTEENDTAGKPLRPHLKKVSSAMGRLMEEDPKLTLADAYNNAVWADPKLRKAALSKQRAAPVSKPGKPKKAKPGKEPSLHDLVTEAHHSAVERANA